MSFTRSAIIFTLAFACKGDPAKDDGTDTDGRSDDTVTTDTDKTKDTDVDDTDEADDTDVDDTDPVPTRTLVRINGDGARQWSDGSNAKSCRAYIEPDAGHEYSGETGSGQYMIDPDGAGANAAIEVTCEMTANGGGFTLIAQAIPVASPAYSLCTAGALATLSPDALTIASPAKLSDAAINQIWAGGPHELRISGAVGVSESPVSSWDTLCTINFADTQVFTSLAGGTWTVENDTVNCASGDIAIYIPYAEDSTCGYGFQMAGGTYQIWSYDEDYGAGCGAAAAGRSWPGSTGNNGCNVSKTWAR